MKSRNLVAAVILICLVFLYFSGYEKVRAQAPQHTSNGSIIYTDQNSGIIVVKIQDGPCSIYVTGGQTTHAIAAGPGCR